ncbi:hypothetical protein ANRL4_04546 [Anaerolineae bacterium]|nr:hypothetical protein ANRL4_04546 [Anaerolineae bacterium]
MITFELNPREAVILHKILQSHHTELETEIADMDIEGMTELLIEEEGVVNKILQHLEQVGLDFSPAQMAGEYVG